MPRNTYATFAIGDKVQLTSPQIVSEYRKEDRTIPVGTLGTVGSIKCPCVMHRPGRPWYFLCVDLPDGTRVRPFYHEVRKVRRDKYGNLILR